MTLPEDAKVDVQPKGHDIARDHRFCQQGSHVFEDVVGRNNLILAHQEKAEMTQEKAKQAVHGVYQLASILQHHLGLALQVPRKNKES